MKNYLQIFISLVFSTSLFARNYQIFSVTQNLPMGTENQIIRKNYYVNIGNNQGVQQGTMLDVFRIVSVLNPYDNRKRVNYKVKIGELEVIHADEEASISKLNKYEEVTQSPVFELDQFIVGDHVAVSIR